MYILGMILLVFFAVIGVASFIGSLVKLNCISDTDEFILLIPHVNEDNAEIRIRSAALMTDPARGCRIICVCGESDPARLICEKLRSQYPRLEIVNEYGHM